MPVNAIRIPKQKRTIAKRDAIIAAGYTLFCEKGYYKTNTAEIAKVANVSTGFYYNYFHDKHDILKEVIALYIATLEDSLNNVISNQIEREELCRCVEELMDALVASHTMNVSTHNEFMALALLDPEIQGFFSAFEAKLMAQIREVLVGAGFSACFLEEKLRISFGIIEQLCHDSIQKKVDETQFAQTKSIAVQVIVNLIGAEEGLSG